MDKPRIVGGIGPSVSALRVILQGSPSLCAFDEDQAPMRWCCRGHCRHPSCRRDEGGEDAGQREDMCQAGPARRSWSSAVGRGSQPGVETPARGGGQRSDGMCSRGTVAAVVFVPGGVILIQHGRSAHPSLSAQIAVRCRTSALENSLAYRSGGAVSSDFHRIKNRNPL